MGGVDLHDQFCNRLLPSLRSKKWTWIPFTRILQAAATNAIVLYNTVRDKEHHITSKDATLAISKQYIRKASLSAHQISLTQDASYVCNSYQCPIRTRNYCQICQIYICKECLVKNPDCPTEDPNVLDESETEQHRMIISPKKISCANKACKTRTQRQCSDCKIFICKNCADDKHK